MRAIHVRCLLVLGWQVAALLVLVLVESVLVGVEDRAVVEVVQAVVLVAEQVVVEEVVVAEEVVAAEGVAEDK